MADAAPVETPASVAPADTPAVAPPLPAWLGPASPARLTDDVVTALAAGDEVRGLRGRT